MEFVSLKDHKNEELWNGLTHLVGVVLSISGIPFLFYFDNNLSSLSTYSILLFSF
jgi:predicted membrane channel-forming protein YqfA (hemolysin III family)